MNGKKGDLKTPDSVVTDPMLGAGETDGLDDLDAVLSELGAGAADVQILVSKFNSDSKARHGFDMCARYQADGFDPFTVAQTYGGGRFKFQFTRGGRIFRAVERSFLLPVQHETRPAPTGESSMAQELRESRAFERQMLLALLTGRPPGGAAAPAPAPGLNVQDMLSLLDFGRKSAVPASTPIDSIKEAFALGRELAGGGARGDDDGEDDVPRRGRGSLLEQLAPRAFDVIERAFLAQSNPSAPANPGTGTVAGAPAPAVRQAPPAPSEDPTADLFRRYAPQILAEARAGRDAYAFGAFVGERAPESAIPSLMQFAEASTHDRQTFLATVAPELLAYQDWITQACEGIRDQFAPDDDSEPAGEKVRADNAS